MKKLTRLMLLILSAEISLVAAGPGLGVADRFRRELGGPPERNTGPSLGVADRARREFSGERKFGPTLGVVEALKPLAPKSSAGGEKGSSAASVFNRSSALTQKYLGQSAKPPDLNKDKTPGADAGPANGTQEPTESPTNSKAGKPKRGLSVPHLPEITQRALEPSGPAPDKPDITKPEPNNANPTDVAQKLKEFQRTNPGTTPVGTVTIEGAIFTGKESAPPAENEATIALREDMKTAARYKQVDFRGPVKVTIDPYRSNRLDFDSKPRFMNDTKPVPAE